ncbi:MAG: hypothetical protein ACOCZ5_00225 [bacterium]
MNVEKQNYYVRLTLKDRVDPGNNNEPFYLPELNLISLVIKENVLSILPRIELIITDKGTLFETYPLLDGERLNVKLSTSKTDEDIMLDCDFLLSDFEVSPNTGNLSSVFRIIGTLYTEDMFFPSITRTFNNTSVEIFRQLTNEFGYKFVNPHNIVSNDNMRWYQLSSNKYDFIKHLLQKSYMNKDSIFYYANTQNEFVCTSLNNEMNKEATFEAKYDRDFAQLNSMGGELQNYIFYDHYDVRNLVGLYHKMTKYGQGFEGYNLKGNMFDGYSVPRNKMTELFNKDKQYDNNFSSKLDVGTIRSNPNLFPRYDMSRSQNNTLRRDFFAQSLSLSVNALTNAKLFDKVNVSIPSILVNKSRIINDVYSGYYLITGITHTVTTNNIYKKQLLLSRNGINKSEFEQEYRVN